MEKNGIDLNSIQQNGMGEKVKGRNIVVVVLFLGWMFACLDRNIMSMALIPIQSEFGLNASVTGIILSGFFLGFLLIQFPGGWLADRWGARKVLLIAVVAWAVFTALTGMAWSIVILVIIRVIYGFFDGFFPSASSKSIAENFPLTQRARAKTIVLLGSGFGGIFAAVLGATFIDSIGWRNTFYMLSLIGILIFILFWFGLKGNMKKQAEQTSTGKASVNKVPVKELLKSPIVWSLGITSLGINFVNWGVATWMPIYLVKARNLSMTEMGTMVALSGIVMLGAAYLVGHILDKITGYEKYTAIFGAVGAAVFLFLLAEAPNAAMAVVFQTLAQICCSFVTFATLTLPLKRFAIQSVGTANGIINTGGQIGSFLSPMVMGFIIDASGGKYSAGFYLLAGCVLISAVAGSRIPIIKGLNKPKKPNKSTDEQVAAPDILKKGEM